MLLVACLVPPRDDVAHALHGLLLGSRTWHRGWPSTIPSNTHSAFRSAWGGWSGALCFGRAAWTLWCLGYPDQGLMRSDEALTWHRTAHPLSLCFALPSYAAMLHQFRREVGQPKSTPRPPSASDGAGISVLLALGDVHARLGAGASRTDAGGDCTDPPGLDGPGVPREQSLTTAVLFGAAGRGMGPYGSGRGRIDTHWPRRWPR